jgi:hypothetical protein
MCRLAMQVFVNISSRGCFYSEELCPLAFTGLLELWWAHFLPCSQLLPRTGSIQILSYTLQRWSLVPIRDQSLAAQPGDRSHPHFLGVGPSRWSKPITVLLHDPAYPPFCSSNLGNNPHRSSTLVVGPTSIDTIHAGLLPLGRSWPRFNLPKLVSYHLVVPTSVDIPHAGLLHFGSLQPRVPTLVTYNPS